MLDMLRDKISQRQATVGVLGLGYVGLPLALAFAKAFRVVGYDPNQEIVRGLAQGKSHIMDVSDAQLMELRARLTFSAEGSCLPACDFIIMCVPTPLIYEKEPDLSFIESCTRLIARYLHRGQFVILESTTYPGTTEEVIVPLLEELSGLRAGVDFGAAYSQERIDPGNRLYTVENIPKVVGGLTPACTDIAAALYGAIIPTIVRVRDCKTAEACKILENVFRSVNIALANEMALILEKMGIDVWEVIAAAATKPYGFMPFYPGPGIGGHCIPLDPYYLAYKARRHDMVSRFVELGGEINDFMRLHTVNLAEAGLARVGKGLRGAQVAVVGLSYKRETQDWRESPAVRIIEELAKSGARVRVYDPYVAAVDTRVGPFRSAASLEAALQGSDCALFLVDHRRFQGLTAEFFKPLMPQPVVVDGRNIFQTAQMAGVVYLAIGKPDTSAPGSPRAGGLSC